MNTVDSCGLSPLDYARNSAVQYVLLKSLYPTISEARLRAYVKYIPENISSTNPLRNNSYIMISNNKR